MHHHIALQRDALPRPSVIRPGREVISARHTRISPRILERVEDMIVRPVGGVGVTGLTGERRAGFDLSRARHSRRAGRG